MICPNCKKEIPDGLLSCRLCGVPLKPPAGSRPSSSRSFDEQLFELDQKFLRGEMDPVEYSMLKNKIEKLISNNPPEESAESPDCGDALSEDFSWEDCGGGSPEAAAAPAASDLVKCPLCGKSHPSEQTFWCPQCGRDYLCFEHRDQATALCLVCAQAPAAPAKAPVPSEVKTLAAEPIEVVAPEPDPTPAPQSAPAPAASTTTVTDARVLRGHKDGIQSISFSPDGKYILSGGDGASLRMWSVRTGQLARSLPAGERGFTVVAITPDGKAAITGDRAQKIMIWDLLLGKNRVIGSHDQWITGLAVSPDGVFVASTAGDGFLKVWEKDSYKKSPRVFQSDRGGLNAVAFSQDGNYILTGGQDLKPRIYDFETGELVAVLKGHGDKITCVALSADGKIAVSGSDDMTIKIWELPAGLELMTLTGHRNPVLCVALSPDGKRVLSGSGQLGVYKAQLGPDFSVRLWDVASGRETCEFAGHEGAVTGVAFAPDGSIAVSAGLDKTVRLWKLPA